MPLLSVNRLEAIVLHVRDLQRAVAWYHEVLGLSAMHRDDAHGIAILSLDGAPLTLWCRGDAGPWPTPSAASTSANNLPSELAPPEGRRSAFPIFEVRDAVAAHAALHDAGLVVTPLHEDLTSRWCEFHDLDGNRLQICESV